MARIRMIKPEFWTDDEVGKLDPLARLLYLSLINYADREGRVEDRPSRLKVLVFGYDAIDAEGVDGLLRQLADHAFIIRYAAEGKAVIQIRSWSKHQHPHPKEAASTLPGQCQVVKLHGANGKDTAKTSDLDLDLGTGTGDGEGAPPAPPAAPVLSGPHRNHAFCCIACVPSFLHRDFRAGLNREDQDAADDELRAGYRAHIDKWPKGKATGEACDFWRAWYRATYPAPTARDTKATVEKRRQDEFFARQA